MDRAEWVSNALKIELNEFQQNAVELLCDAVGLGPYDFYETFKRADWDYGKGIRFAVDCKGRGFATTDANGLTKLVIGAHDKMIRVEIRPLNFRHLEITMFPRISRDGEISVRHPTIEQAIDDYRGTKRGNNETI